MRSSNVLRAEVLPLAAQENRVLWAAMDAGRLNEQLVGSCVEAHII